MFKETTFEQFTQELASKSAIPGGGGASALVGAIGIALGSMVGSLTVGNKRYADVEEEMLSLMERAEALRCDLLKAADEDAEAFEPLSRAYAIPKEEEGRAEELERCLKLAAEAPLGIMKLCCEAIDILEVFAEKGNKMVLSDAATGVAIAGAALKGAAVNVRVNTRLMKDRAFAEKMNKEVDERTSTYEKKANDIYDGVMERLG